MALLLLLKMKFRLPDEKGGRSPVVRRDADFRIRLQQLKEKNTFQIFASLR